eukprot:145648-Hanusia_phi.AAC.1
MFGRVSVECPTALRAWHCHGATVGVIGLGGPGPGLAATQVAWRQLTSLEVTVAAVRRAGPGPAS